MSFYPKLSDPKLSDFRLSEPSLILLIYSISFYPELSDPKRGDLRLSEPSLPLPWSVPALIFSKGNYYFAVIGGQPTFVIDMTLGS